MPLDPENHHLTFLRWSSYSKELMKFKHIDKITNKSSKKSLKTFWMSLCSMKKPNIFFFFSVLQLWTATLHKRVLVLLYVTTCQPRIDNWSVWWQQLWGADFHRPQSVVSQGLGLNVLHNSVRQTWPKYSNLHN